MSKFTSRLAIALFTFLLGITAVTLWFIKVQERQGLRLMIPANWEPLGFKVIDERTDEANLPRLRTVLLPNQDFEVRIWVGFGINGEEGLILRRSSDQWSGVHIHGTFERYPPEKYQLSLIAPTPKSGWKKAWRRLVDAGILTLPDASVVQCNTYINDGTSYVVEVNMNKTYRIYLYDNPDHAKCNEAKQMIEIGEIIADEFRIEDFRIRD